MKAQAYVPALVEKNFFGTVFIAPALDEEKTIARCIKSMSTQESANWRFVIGDNKSSDETVKVANSMGDGRVLVIPWKERCSSLENCLRSSREALEAFPNAGRFQMIGADDELGNRSSIPEELYPSSTDTVLLPKLFDGQMLQIGPNLFKKDWARSKVTLLRALSVSSWSWTDIIYGNYPRALFVSYLEAVEESMQGTPEDDWRGAANFLLVQPVHFFVTGASIVRHWRPKSYWHAWHGQWADAKPKEVNSMANYGRTMWAWQEIIRVLSHRIQRSRPEMLTTLTAMVVSSAARDLYLTVVRLFKFVLDWMLSPFGIRIRRSAQDGRLHLEKKI
jgi:glycosyltransferase involved in cell wall biosynthesis